MFYEIELSKSCVLEALTALDEGRDATEVAKLASLAKAKVGETYGLGLVRAFKCMAALA